MYSLLTPHLNYFSPSAERLIDVWIDENIVNEKILKERKIDPDVWVLELETDTFWNPLEEI